MIKFGVKTDPARLLIRRADAARDEKRYRDAAALYAEALRIDPSRGGIHVQAGHMFKEAGELDVAERHYLAAVDRMPDDADLALQLGHFYKLAGRVEAAIVAYRRAAALAPGSAEADEQLTTLAAAGWTDAAVEGPEAQIAELLEGGERVNGLKLAGLYGKLAPENLPKPAGEMLHYSDDAVILRQLGATMNTFWGMQPVLRGIEAIRGFALSAAPLTHVEAQINGLTIHRGPLSGPFELEYEPDRTRIHKYVFNIWCDVSALAPGRYELGLILSDGAAPMRSITRDFVVEPPLIAAEHPESDGVIDLPAGGAGTLDARINALPSAAHEAQRPDRIAEMRNILVLRPDQLGDLVSSIPGILRLRAMFPDARLVGLFSPANHELARTLNVFDEIILLDFRESLAQRTRTLPLDEQEKLRDRLAPYDFDLAVDLSQSLMSRPLLAISGARFTYGFKDPNWPRLTASVDDTYHDVKNHKEIATHSTRIVTMIDRLGKLLTSSAEIIRRDDLPRALLHCHGIADGDRFAVLHTGARIVFSRWPHYLELAARLHAETDLKIVLFTGDIELRDKLDPAIRDSERIVILAGQLAFDEFDALLSYCAVYVGNDSGPKHLASLRGVPVVSIHSARINWSEWGQEHSGVIITRKVPCAGCLLYHDADECGKDYVCINGIGLDDVYAAVRRYV